MTTAIKPISHCAKYGHNWTTGIVPGFQVCTYTTYSKNDKPIQCGATRRDPNAAPVVPPSRKDTPMTQTPVKSARTTLTQSTNQRNSVAFIGYTGKDPELNYTGKGRAVTKFSLSVNQGRDKDPMWLNIVCWGELAEKVAENISKGDQIQVEGRLTQRVWDGKYYHDVVAEKIEIIETKRARDARKAREEEADTAGDPLGELDDHPF